MKTFWCLNLSLLGVLLLAGVSQGDKDYFIVNNISFYFGVDKVNWQEAVNVCGGKGMTLWTVGSQAEIDLVTKQIAQFNIGQSEHFWTDDIRKNDCGYITITKQQEFESCDTLSRYICETNQWDV